MVKYFNVINYLTENFRQDLNLEFRTVSNEIKLFKCNISTDDLYVDVSPKLDFARVTYCYSTEKIDRLINKLKEEGLEVHIDHIHKYQIRGH